MGTEDKIRQFIVEKLHAGSAQRLTDDFPLIEQEVFDSMGIFQIVAFLENEFGVRIDDDDLVPENFASIRSISRLVQTRT